MLILDVITAMRRAKSSSIMNNGRKTKRKRRSKFRNKPTMTVTAREAGLMLLNRSCFSCMNNMMEEVVPLLRRGSL
jgi:hypothetical protein